MELVGSLPCAQREVARHGSLLSSAGSQESWEPARVIAQDKFTRLGGFPSKAASTLLSVFLRTLESMSVITRALRLFYPTSKPELKKNKIFDIPKGKDVFQFSSKGAFSAHIGLLKINTKMHQGLEARAAISARAKCHSAVSVPWSPHRPGSAGTAPTPRHAHI